MSEKRRKAKREVNIEAEGIFQIYALLEPREATVHKVGSKGVEDRWIYQGGYNEGLVA